MRFISTNHREDDLFQKTSNTSNSFISVNKFLFLQFYASKHSNILLLLLIGKPKTSYNYFFLRVLMYILCTVNFILMHKTLCVLTNVYNHIAAIKILNIYLLPKGSFVARCSCFPLITSSPQQLLFWFLLVQSCLCSEGH